MDEAAELHGLFPVGDLCESVPYPVAEALPLRAVLVDVGLLPCVVCAAGSVAFVALEIEADCDGPLEVLRSVLHNRKLHCQVQLRAPLLFLRLLECRPFAGVCHVLCGAVLEFHVRCGGHLQAVSGCHPFVGVLAETFVGDVRFLLRAGVELPCAVCLLTLSTFNF